MEDETPDSFAEHVYSLYMTLKETYGDPLSTEPDSTTYDLSGNKTMRILLEDQSAIKEYFKAKYDEKVDYSCKWDICSLLLRVSKISIDKTWCYVSLSWNKDF